MKMLPEHYEYLKREVEANLTVVPPLEEYQKAGMSAKRWRWDIMWAAKVSNWVGQNLYSYLNDDHIDTALKKITGTK